MRVTVGIDPIAARCKVIDNTTGNEIKDCFMADDDTGEYGTYLRDDKGNFILTELRDGVEREYKTGDIKIIIE